MPSVKYFLNELKKVSIETYEHSVRCGNILAIFAEEMGYDKFAVDSFREAGFMHDIGKLQCIDTVNSNVNLRELEAQIKTDADRAKFEKFKKQMILRNRTHVKYGMPICKSIDGADQNMHDAINYHHCTYKRSSDSYCADSLHLLQKKNNFTECPEEDNIPVIAQMLHIVDVYDALKQKRSYKEEMSEEKVFDIMQKNADIGSFNPSYYEIFKSQIVPLIPAGNKLMEVKTMNPKLKAAVDELGLTGVKKPFVNSSKLKL